MAEEQFLSYSSSAWPTRITGISIFVVLAFLYELNANFPIFLLGIAFVFMLVAILFSADVTLTAQKGAVNSVAVIKKRMILSSSANYNLDDIVYISRNMRVVVDNKGHSSQRIEYTLALKSKSGGPLYGRGYLPLSLPIPTSWITMFNRPARDMQALARASALAAFIGVPLYENGGQNDFAINTSQDIHQWYMKDLKNFPDDVFARAKEENDRAAKEILDQEKR